MTNNNNNNNGVKTDIHESLFIPRDSGFLVIVNYSDPIPVSVEIENEIILKMVHAYHGIFKTSFVGDRTRSLVYWFKSERNANRFVKDFTTKGKVPEGFRAERFENDLHNDKEYDIYGYGLLSENVLL